MYLTGGEDIEEGEVRRNVSTKYLGVRLGIDLEELREVNICSQPT